MKENTKSILYGVLSLTVGLFLMYQCYTEIGVHDYLTGIIVMTAVSVIWFMTDPVIDLIKKDKEDVIYKEDLKIALIQIIIGTALLASYILVYELTDDAMHITFAGLVFSGSGIWRLGKWIYWNSKKRKEIRREELIEINDERNQIIALKTMQLLYKELLMELFIIVIWLVFIKDYAFVIYLLSIAMVFQNGRTYKSYYEKVEKEM